MKNKKTPSQEGVVDTDYKGEPTPLANFSTKSISRNALKQNIKRTIIERSDTDE